MDKSEIEKRFGSSVRVTLVDITPQLAQKWLSEKNTHNRPIYKKVVDQYSLDMKRGFWSLNHQGICFDTDDVLMDGQHRLLAIVQSGVTIPMYVFRNMPKNFGTNGNVGYTQDTIDDIKKRSIGDKLNLSYGIENGNLVSAMTYVIANICTMASRRQSTMFSKRVYDLYQTEIDLAVKNRTLIKNLTVAPVLGSIAFAAKVYPAQAIDFELKYFSGADLSANHPILKFRDYMVNKQVGYKRSRAVVINYSLSALMHFIQGNKPKNLKVSQVAFDFFKDKQQDLVQEIIQMTRL